MIKGGVGVEREFMYTKNALALSQSDNSGGLRLVGESFLCGLFGGRSLKVIVNIYYCEPITEPQVRSLFCCIFGLCVWLRWDLQLACAACVCEREREGKRSHKCVCVCGPWFRW